MMEAGHVYVSNFVKEVCTENKKNILFGFIIGQFINQKYFALHVIPCSIVKDNEPFSYENNLKDRLRRICDILPGGLNIIGVLFYDDYVYDLPLKRTKLLNIVSLFYGSYPVCFNPDKMYYPIWINVNTDIKYFIYDKKDNEFEITDSPLNSNFKLIYFSTRIYSDVYLPAQLMENSRPIYEKVISSLSIYFDTLRSSKLIFRDNFIPDNYKWTEDQFKNDEFNLIIEQSSSELGSVITEDFNQTLCLKGSILCRPCVSTAVLTTSYIESALKEDLFRSLNVRIFLTSIESTISGMTQLADWSLLSPLRVEISIDENPLSLKFTDYVFCDESANDIKDRMLALTNSSIKSDMIEYLEKAPEKEDLVGINSLGSSSDISTQDFSVNHNHKSNSSFCVLTVSRIIAISVIVLIIAIIIYKSLDAKS